MIDFDTTKEFFSDIFCLSRRIDNHKCKNVFNIQACDDISHTFKKNHKIVSAYDGCFYDENNTIIATYIKNRTFITITDHTFEDERTHRAFKTGPVEMKLYIDRGLFGAYRQFYNHNLNSTYQEMVSAFKKKEHRFVFTNTHFKSWCNDRNIYDLKDLTIEDELMFEMEYNNA